MPIAGHYIFSVLRHGKFQIPFRKYNSFFDTILVCSQFLISVKEANQLNWAASVLTTCTQKKQCRKNMASAEKHPTRTFPNIFLRHLRKKSHFNISCYQFTQFHCFWIISMVFNGAKMTCENNLTNFQWFSKIFLHLTRFLI